MNKIEDFAKAFLLGIYRTVTMPIILPIALFMFMGNPSTAVNFIIWGFRIEVTDND